MTATTTVTRPAQTMGDELAARLQAAAAAVMLERGKPPTAWQIAARAVQLGAPYERRTEILKLAQAMAAPPPAAPARKPRSHAAMVREAQRCEQAASLREAAGELYEMVEGLRERRDDLAPEKDAAEYERLLDTEIRFERLADTVSTAADDLETDGGEAVA